LEINKRVKSAQSENNIAWPVLFSNLWAMPVEMSARKTPPAPARFTSLWLAIALGLVTLAVFCPVTGFQFVNFDDPSFVTANPHVRNGLTVEGLQWAWHSEVLGNWHPITMLSLMLDCQLFGVKPWWPHLVNLLLHTANTLLLFGLLQRMTGAVWRSAAVAALFALHPLHVESVVWVCERKDVLSTLFWFLTTWAYVRYVEEFKVQPAVASPWRGKNAKRKVFYGLSLFFFALGLMSKAMLVTLPCALLLLDYWPLGRMKPGASVWRLTAEKIPFFAMSTALCVVTFRLQNHVGSLLSLQRFPLSSRLCDALVAYVRYIEMMFWPRHLAGHYPRSGQWPWWEVTLAASLLLAVSGLVLAQWRRRPYLAVGWFWYLGTLVPVIGLVQVGGQDVGDRYTYVPLTGLFVILVWGGWELAGAWRVARFAPPATVAALATCAVLTMHQEFYWKDSETLYKRMIDATSNNFLAHNNLGIFYLEAHRTNDALTNFTAAVQEKPDFADAHNNLGSIFMHQKRYDEALPHLQAAAGLHPEYLFCFNFANALAEVATARHDAKAFAQAVQIYQQALQFNPESSDAHHNLGLAWQGEGRPREALAEFEQAAHLDPNRIDTWIRLGFLYFTEKRMPDAEGAFQQAIRLQPTNADTYGWLGDVLAKENKLADAADHYRQALRINPNYVEAQTALRALQNRPNSPPDRNR
jgi:protein O-mannosyl-transferase